MGLSGQAGDLRLFQHVHRLALLPIAIERGLITLLALVLFPSRLHIRFECGLLNLRLLDCDNSLFHLALFLVSG